VKKHHVLIPDFELTAMHPDGKPYGFNRGRRVFVSGGIPGEKLTISMEKRQTGYFMADIEKITAPSPFRTRPFCKHAGLCGGCNWQHIAYDHQLELKRGIISEALTRQGIDFTEIKPVIPSDQQIFYRNRIEYSFSATRWFYEEEGDVDDPVKRLAVGFNIESRADRVLDIEECFLQPEPSHHISRVAKEIAIKQELAFWNLKQKTGLLRNLEIRNNTHGDTMAIVGFVYDEPALIQDYLTELSSSFPALSGLFYTVLADPLKGINGTVLKFSGQNDFITEISSNQQFRIQPEGFYQTNPAQAAYIFHLIRNLAGAKPEDLVYDLYTGSGAIAITLATDAGRVVGIEGMPSAVEEANQNAKLNNIENCSFVCGDVLKTFTPAFCEQYGNPDIIILDPPRSGTLIEIKKTMLQAKPRSIIYVSCNPAALAKDLKMLTTEYVIDTIQPVDMFPHTHHIETVVKLNLKPQ
jgi:23S rRNA (uracil1939-C5)-methyltransferase